MLGLGPVGLCAVQVAQAAGAEKVIAVDTVEERLRMAESFGAQAVHLTEEDPRAAVKEATEGRGVDVAVDAVGHPEALDMAIRLARKARHGLRRPASTPSAPRSTWGWSGSRR